MYEKKKCIDQDPQQKTTNNKKVNKNFLINTLYYKLTRKNILL